MQLVAYAFLKNSKCTESKSLQFPDFSEMLLIACRVAFSLIFGLKAQIDPAKRLVTVLCRICYKI